MLAEMQCRFLLPCIGCSRYRSPCALGQMYPVVMDPYSIVTNKTHSRSTPMHDARGALTAEYCEDLQASVGKCAERHNAGYNSGTQNAFVLRSPRLAITAFIKELELR